MIFVFSISGLHGGDELPEQKRNLHGFMDHSSSHEWSKMELQTTTVSLEVPQPNLLRRNKKNEDNFFPESTIIEHL